MSSTVIEALSPLDGRYAGKLANVRYLFSEAGLMRERVDIAEDVILVVHQDERRISVA